MIFKYKTWFILYLLLFSRFLVGAEFPQHLILTTHNLAPYGSFVVQADNGEDQIADKRFRGVAVDVVRCALAALNIEYTINVMSWGRAQAK